MAATAWEGTAASVDRRIMGSSQREILPPILQSGIEHYPSLRQEQYETACRVTNRSRRCPSQLLPEVASVVLCRRWWPSQLRQREAVQWPSFFAIRNFNLSSFNKKRFVAKDRAQAKIEPQPFRTPGGNWCGGSRTGCYHITVLTCQAACTRREAGPPFCELA